MIVWSCDHMIWSNDRSIVWSYDRTIVWSYALIIWSYDRTIVWSDRMIVWSYDRMVCSDRTVRASDHMIWFYGRSTGRVPNHWIRDGPEMARYGMGGKWLSRRWKKMRTCKVGPKWVSEWCAENDLAANWLQHDEVQAGPNMTKYRMGPQSIDTR